MTFDPYIFGVGPTGPWRWWTVARVLKGSARSLRVMAPPPYYMLITQNGVLRHHLRCLSTPPQCGIPTFTVGTCSNGVKIKRGLLSLYPATIMSFYFDVRRIWSEGIYEGPHSFPQSLFRLTLRGRGGLLSFGVNLRVLSILFTRSLVFAQKCTLITFIGWIH